MFRHTYDYNISPRAANLDVCLLAAGPARAAGAVERAEDEAHRAPDVSTVLGYWGNTMRGAVRN